MQVTYELAERDYYEAMVVMRNRKRFWKWLLRAIFLLVLACFAALLVGSLVDGRMLDGLVPIGALALFWIFLYWVQPRWWARKQFRTQRSAGLPQTLTADESGLHWQGEGAKSDIEWANVLRTLEGPRILILFFSEFAFLVLPKRAFVPEQLADFRALLTQNTVQK